MKALSIHPLAASNQLVQVLAGCAAGGFPSPAADYYEPPLSLDERLNIRAPHVWLVQVEGDSMRDAGIFDGSLLVVDRSITPSAGHIVLAYVDNQPLVKRLARSPAGWLLESANPDYPTIPPSQYDSIEVFGVVVWSVTPHVQ
ncbi:UV resistance protein [Pseudomonas putida]|uniref:LexA family protein n=1 Tax=Pseudomonas putida TaxID=303 RepID=UPI0007DC0DC3|nr:translesion error-prone DNA polymerase V autoproteolytic subunit [Pseudomonas putida]OAS07789.1 UV resistance protein [Pseudomonas putida]QNV69384.1 translesion error-prone DNA polymerase V autoproteolytic subunit [Pseudomonas sp. CFA]